MQLVNLLLSAALMMIQFVPGTPQPGTVTGRIDIKPKPQQQAASRYPSAGGQMQKEIIPIPAVVYIDGPVAGAPAWPRPPKAAIVQKNLQFSPALLVIPTGTSVDFPNEDTEFHNVFSYSKSKRFDLGRYRMGESKRVLFDKPGIVKIYCEVHPWMRAVVLVLENPFYAIPAGDGSFSIKGIPAGHYDLVVWSIDAGSKKVGVDVPAGREVDLLFELQGGSESAAPDRILHPGKPTSEVPDAAMAMPAGACCAKKR